MKKILLTLTYTPKDTPNTRLTAFIQRLRRYAKQLGCDNCCCKNIAKLDNKGQSTRIHHHIILTLSDADTLSDVDTITKIWKNGFLSLQKMTGEQYQNVLRWVK